MEFVTAQRHNPPHDTFQINEASTNSEIVTSYFD